MSEATKESESDRIVSRGREERAAKRAQGLDPSAETPKMQLMSRTPRESLEQYKRRVTEHKINSNILNPKIDDNK